MCESLKKQSNKSGHIDVYVNEDEFQRKTKDKRKSETKDVHVLWSLKR